MIIIRKSSGAWIIVISLLIIYFYSRKMKIHQLDINPKLAPCRMYSYPASVKKDSLEVLRILNMKSHRINRNIEVIRKNIFAKSTVELLYTSRKRTDFSV